MKHIFIINPVAGNGKYQTELEKNIRNYFGDKIDDYEIYFTKGKNDAKSFVCDRSDENVPYIFYSCGGDGTLHEIINAACRYKHISVGLIPCGSGNDFAKSFNNIDSFFDIDAQVKGRREKVDLIKVNGEYAVSVCNIGFDADAAFNMHKFKKIPFISGSGCYYLGVLSSLIKRLGKKLDFVLDNEIYISGEYSVSVIANGNYYGGGYKCAPYAGINDGMLDVCLIDKISRIKVLDLIDKYKRGEHVLHEATKNICTYKRCKNVSIKGDQPINLCVDGESYVYDKVELEAIEGMISFNVPLNCQIINAQGLPELADSVR